MIFIDEGSSHKVFLKHCFSSSRTNTNDQTLSAYVKKVILSLAPARDICVLQLFKTFWPPGRSESNWRSTRFAGRICLPSEFLHASKDYFCCRRRCSEFLMLMKVFSSWRESRVMIIYRFSLWSFLTTSESLALPLNSIDSFNSINDVYLLPCHALSDGEASDRVVWMSRHRWRSWQRSSA